MRGAARREGIPGVTCQGLRPWLPGSDLEECDAELKMLQRGATNLYFARTASSILIPPWSQKIEQVLDTPRYWSILAAATVEGEVDQTRVQVVAELARVEPDLLGAALVRRISGQDLESAGIDSEEEYRRQEYRALVGAQTDPEDRLVLAPQDRGRYETIVSDWFDQIVLVEKLTETRALIGFDRVVPAMRADSFEVDWNRLAEEPRSWLPAFQVHGEGIFLTLDPHRVTEWAGRTQQRLSTLQERTDRIAEERNRRSRPVPPAFVLLHTLAHLLIRRLTFECGYGSSSLRERLYWNGLRADGSFPAIGDDDWMCGLLIYTAAGDSEGTLGGLVRQGKPGRLESVVLYALDDAQWCSSDPLCRDTKGQGTDGLNLAACHACALLPETSCEEGNRYLDRVVTLDLHPSGFDRDCGS